MAIHVSPRGYIARICAVDDHGYRLYVQYPNGQSGTVDHPPQPLHWPVGTVVAVNAAERYIDRVPARDRVLGRALARQALGGRSTPPPR